MYKCCIFDLDGTLLDAIDAITDACNYALTKYNLPVINKEDYKVLLSKGRKVLINSIIPDNYKNNDTRDKIFELFNQHYEKNMIDNTKPFEGIIELIDELYEKSILLAIVSNKPHPLTRIIVNHFFENKIKVVFGHRDDYEIKPNPDTVLEVIHMLNIKKSDCVFIGDTEVDIKTAKNANIDSIGVLWGFKNREVLENEGADYIVSNVKQLKDLIVNNVIKKNIIQS